MEIRYSREMNHNYMIIKEVEGDPGYACRMLSDNAVEGLLRFQVRQKENAREYYYEITSRQPLSRILEKRKLSGTELRKLLLGVLAVLGRIEEYLLKEEMLLLEPDYMYLEPDQFIVELCLVPGHVEEIPQALSKLLKYLLERIDHQDQEAVVLAYNLYQASLKENYGTVDLQRQLAGKDRIFFEKKRADLAEAERYDSGQIGLERDRLDAQGKGWENGVSEEDGRWGREEYGRKGRETFDFQRPLGAYRENRTGAEQMAHNKMGIDLSTEERTHPNRTSGTKKRNWIKWWVKGVGAAFLVGTAYWYVTGEMGIWLYILSLGACIVAIISGMLTERRNLVRVQRQSEEIQGEKGKAGRAENNLGKNAGDDGRTLWGKRKQNRWMPESAGEDASPKRLSPRRNDGQTWSSQDSARINNWEVHPESEEAYRQACLQEDEKQMERAKEAGTTLLSDQISGGVGAMLEPIELGKEPIRIPYMPFTLGKHKELADAWIDRDTVSRLHARLDQTEGIYILTDLNSTNGTSVNGYQLQANETVSLKGGDLIYLADVGYKFWENK